MCTFFGVLFLGYYFYIFCVHLSVLYLHASILYRTRLRFLFFYVFLYKFICMFVCILFSVNLSMYFICKFACVLFFVNLSVYFIRKFVNVYFSPPCKIKKPASRRCKFTPSAGRSLIFFPRVCLKKLCSGIYAFSVFLFLLFISIVSFLFLNFLPLFYTLQDSFLYSF